MQINEIVISNMADLESEVAEKLECMKRRIQSTCSQTSNNEHKYRQDICSLMKFIKNAYHHDNWDTQGLQFQTVNLTEILDMRNTTVRCIIEIISQLILLLTVLGPGTIEHYEGEWKFVF